MKLQINQAGLNIKLDKFSGNIQLNYRYPIQARHFSEFQTLETDLGIKAIAVDFKDKKTENIKTRYACYLNLYGNSKDVLPKFTYVQYELMKYSRLFKLAYLHKEIQGLKQMTINLKPKTDEIHKNETV